jgi:hypothetical protein
MGNTKSTSCSNRTSISEEDLRLTDYDMTIYETRKEKIFKGTLAVCIVYASLALLLLVGSYMFPSLKYVVFESFLPFTIVFIIGTILLIAYLFYSVLNYKPVKINKNFDYTNISCPDYWTLEFNNNFGNYIDSNSVNPTLFNYRCVLNSNIFSKYDIYKTNKIENVQNVGITSTGVANDTPDTNINTLSAIDDIDSPNNKYYFADIKHDSNIAKIKKIIGTNDSNIYNELVTSSLLMNNYVKDSSDSTSEKTVYKQFGNADTNDVDNEKQNLYNGNDKTTYKIEPVKINNESGVTNTIGTIHIKKLSSIPSDSTYLDNITTDGNTAVPKIPLVCNRVYPLLLATKDKEISKNSSGRYDENILRCAYSKLCGVPWSDMNCDKYGD